MFHGVVRLLSLFFHRYCLAWWPHWLPRLRSLDSPAGVPAGPQYHYVIVRRDLPHGVQVAQTIHAAGESAGRVAPGTHAVALHARDEQQLLEIEQRLAASPFQFQAIREPDAPWLGALMAIGLSPVHRTPELRQLLGKLPLVK